MKKLLYKELYEGKRVLAKGEIQSAGYEWKVEGYVTQENFVDCVGNNHVVDKEVDGWVFVSDETYCEGCTFCSGYIEEEEPEFWDLYEIEEQEREELK